MFGGLGKVAARRPSALTINPNVNSTELMNLSIGKSFEMDVIFAAFGDGFFLFFGSFFLKLF